MVYALEPFRTLSSVNADTYPQFFPLDDISPLEWSQLDFDHDHSAFDPLSDHQFFNDMTIQSEDKSSCILWASSSSKLSFIRRDSLKWLNNTQSFGNCSACESKVQRPTKLNQNLKGTPRKKYLNELECQNRTVFKPWDSVSVTTINQARSPQSYMLIGEGTPTGWFRT